LPRRPADGEVFELLLAARELGAGQARLRGVELGRGDAPRFEVPLGALERRPFALVGLQRQLALALQQHLLPQERAQLIVAVVRAPADRLGVAVLERPQALEPEIGGGDLRGRAGELALEADVLLLVLGHLPAYGDHLAALGRQLGGSDPRVGEGAVRPTAQGRRSHGQRRQRQQREEPRRLRRREVTRARRRPLAHADGDRLGMRLFQLVARLHGPVLPIASGGARYLFARERGVTALQRSVRDLERRGLPASGMMRATRCASRCAARQRNAALDSVSRYMKRRHQNSVALMNEKQAHLQGRERRRLAVHIPANFCRRLRESEAGMEKRRRDATHRLRHARRVRGSVRRRLRAARRPRRAVRCGRR